MIKHIGRVPHLPTDRQQTLCLFCFMIFHTFLSYFTELRLAIDLQCVNAGAFHYGFRQTAGSSVYTRANQFLHFVWNQNCCFEAPQFGRYWNPQVKHNCLQGFVLIGSLRKDTDISLPPSTWKVLHRPLKQLIDISVFLPKVHDLKMQIEMIANHTLKSLQAFLKADDILWKRRAGRGARNARGRGFVHSFLSFSHLFMCVRVYYHL